MKKPNSLYYICHVENLGSILEKGIFSRQDVQSQNITHKDIHDPGVLSQRDKTLPGDKNLQEYVNLYFQPRNAMLYRLMCNLGRKPLAVLQVDSSVLDVDGSYFSDRNAAAYHARFFSKLSDLKRVDEKVFKKEYWTDSDDTKQRMMAEVLVPEPIPPDGILTVYRPLNDETVTMIVGDKPIAVEPYIFFLPTWRSRLNGSISLSKGDMFFSSMQTFTISVNLKGIMGRGLASRTKYQFPDAYVRYQDDCKSKKLQVGKPTLFKRGIRIEEELADDPSKLDPSGINGFRWFLFFPTKRHWRDASRFEDIELSMQWLVENYEKQGIESIALPALGCGLGNLHWKDIGPMMCHYLNKMAIRSCIYLPMEEQLEPDLMNAEYLLNSYDV